MKLAIAAATLLIGATLTAQAAPGHQQSACIARIVHSEELPFAPAGYWLVKVTLEITPPNGQVFQMTLQDSMPWQGPPPRRGQIFRVWCDPANPGDLRLVHQGPVRTAF
jgi:hypothetical protein